MRSIQADPWLHYGGLICIHTEQNAKLWEDRLKSGNVVSFIPAHELDFSLPRVLRILGQNRQFLFQREIQESCAGVAADRFPIFCE